MGVICGVGHRVAFTAAGQLEAVWTRGCWPLYTFRNHVRWTSVRSCAARAKSESTFAGCTIAPSNQPWAPEGPTIPSSVKTFWLVTAGGVGTV